LSVANGQPDAADPQEPSEALVAKTAHLREKLAKLAGYVAFQMAEVANPRQMFHQILWLIAELRPQPPPAPA
jgi:hypothetical protein